MTKTIKRLDLLIREVTDPHAQENFTKIKGFLDSLSSSGITGSQGPQGPAGPPGAPGTSYQEAFETVSKNLKSWDATLNYTSGTLTSIVYVNGVSSITKTFNYTSGNLTSIVLSGDTPSGIELTKTLTYTSGNLTSIGYS